MKNYRQILTFKFCVLSPLQVATGFIRSLGQKWSTVPFTRALKYYIPLGDISIVAWPSSLKRKAYGVREELGNYLGWGGKGRGGSHGLGMNKEGE